MAKAKKTTKSASGQNSDAETKEVSKVDPSVETKEYKGYQFLVESFKYKGESYTSNEVINNSEIMEELIKIEFFGIKKVKQDD